MALLGETFKYLKKSFWILLLYAIVPSIVISFFVKPFSSITFLPTLFVGQTDYDFIEIFAMITSTIVDVSVFGDLIGGIVFFVFMWIAAVLCLCVAEKHLKTGELSLKISKNQFFTYAFPIFFSLVLWIVLYLVCLAAQSGFISLIHFVCGVTPPTTIDCILSTVVSLLIFTAILYCSVHLLFLPLITVYYGYGLRESFVESLRMTSDNMRTLLLGFLVPMLVAIIADVILSTITALLAGYAGMSLAAKYWIDYIISVITLALIIMYLVAYALVSFYKLSGLERRDIRKYDRRR